MVAFDSAIYEEDVEKIDALISLFLKRSGALCVILIDKSGQLIAKGGLTKLLPLDAISALAAGAFLSTDAMAQMIGETQFSALFHQGKKEHIHVSTVSENIIMLVVFDDKTTVGMVRLYVKNTEKDLRSVFEEADKRPPEQRKKLKPLSEAKIQKIFIEKRNGQS